MKKMPIEETQKAELAILSKVDEICGSLNLRYYLAYGTVLGAVRHKGFIPWDDDLDIIMPRPDYNKLIKYFEKNKDDLYPFKPIYGWHDFRYSYAMTRITDMKYKIVYKEYGPYSTEDMGVFIDVYPYDGVGNNKQNAIKIAKESSALYKWIARAHYDQCLPTTNRFKRILQSIVYKYAHIIGEEHYHKKLLKLIAKNDYDTSKYIASLSWDDFPVIFKKELFDNGAGEKNKVDFCGKKFIAPAKLDEYLKINYGDYMKLPPVNKRVATHYYDAYARSEYEKKGKC